MLRVDKHFKLKPDSTGDPDFCLGDTIREVTLANGVTPWSVSSSKHVQDAARNVRDCLKQEHDRSLPKRAACPFPTNCRPELNLSQELSPEDAGFCMPQVVMNMCPNQRLTILV